MRHRPVKGSPYNVADDIYRDDIIFRDPRNCFSGIKNYQIIFWSLRFHGRLFFKELYVEVKRIWQKDDHTIYLRWTVHGFPRLPWDQEGTFDGVSTYKLDCHGKVRVPAQTLFTWSWSGVKIFKHTSDVHDHKFMQPWACRFTSTRLTT